MRHSSRYKYRYEFLEERFWKYVEDLSFHTDEDCWNWVGYKAPNGYGKILFVAQKFTSSRIAYFILVDRCRSNLLIEPSKIVCHKCDNPACVNPNHLYLGTDKDNARDRSIRNRVNGYKPTVPTEIINQIKEEIKLGIMLKDIAVKYNLSPSYISKVKRNKIKARNI